MLKQPLPTRVRRHTGIVLVTLFAFGSAYVAWAAQSPRPTPIAVAAGTQVDAQLAISFDGAPPKTVRMVHPVGESFALKSDDGAWDAEFVARPVTGDAIELASTIRRDGKVAGHPVIVTKPGQPASIEVGEPGRPRLRLEATLALLQGDAAKEPAIFSLENAATYRKLMPPAYPASAIQNEVEGMVYLDVAIDAEGRVLSATVDHADPTIASVLGPAAINAVKTWWFNPPMRDGKLFATHVKVPLRFAISDPGSVKVAPLPPGTLDVIDVVGKPDQ